MGLSEATEIQRVAGTMLQEVLRRTHLASAPELAGGLALPFTIDAGGRVSGASPSPTA